MKRITKTLFLLCSALLLFASWNAQADDSRAMAAMKQDYPGLMSLYGDRIAGQKVHYIFVVDVSSSMLPYESTVKTNILQFLDDVPDGDQISLIKMSDESHTGYVGLLKCTPLSPDVRTSIRDVVNGFRFNRNGSSEDGSDGFQWQRPLSMPSIPWAVTTSHSFTCSLTSSTGPTRTSTTKIRRTGYTEYAPGQGVYCESTGHGFHPGDVPKDVDTKSLVVLS